MEYEEISQNRFSELWYMGKLPAFFASKQTE